MFIYKNLEEIIFKRHQNVPSDQLIILSGYIGPEPVMRLKNLPFPVTLVYGMYASEGIKEQLHKTLLGIQEKQKNISIFYSQIPVHSKCYIWLKNSAINTALVGSANFSVSGLANDYKEALAEITTDSYVSLKDYYSYILENSRRCDDLNPKFKHTSFIKSKTNALQPIEQDPLAATVTFLTNGEVPEKSGLNWGLANGHVKLGDAYIPLHKSIIAAHPALILPKQGFSSKKTKGAKNNRQNDAVEFIWDDGTVMQGLLEGSQDNKSDGLVYPKQMCSSPNKNILGKYLRKRLGVGLGHKITRRDLERYGRTDIKITLLGEGIYGLDFSVNKK